MNRYRFSAPVFFGLTLAGWLAATPFAFADSKKVSIDATEFKYSPQAIELKPGRTLEIVMENNGVLAHNITFSDKDVATETVQSGNQTSVTVTFDKAGEYEFFCSVPGHKNAGMTGTVIVQ